MYRPDSTTFESRTSRTWSNPTLSSANFAARNGEVAIGARNPHFRNPQFRNLHFQNLYIMRSIVEGGGFVSTSSCHVAYACILLLTWTEACMRTPRDSCIFTMCSATFRKCGFGPVYYEKETLSFKSEESSKPTLSKVGVWACMLHPLIC